MQLKISATAGDLGHLHRASFQTRALVTHMQHQGIALLISSKADRQRRGAGVEGVFDQGGQALLQPLRIPHRHWQLRRWRV